LGTQYDVESSILAGKKSSATWILKAWLRGLAGWFSAPVFNTQEVWLQETLPFTQNKAAVRNFGSIEAEENPKASTGVPLLSLRRPLHLQGEVSRAERIKRVLPK
jgi:hypothetical protein